MIARYKRCGIKVINFNNKKYDISDEWQEISDIRLFKKLKKSPDIFETASFFDIKQFEPVEKYIEIKKNIIKTAHNGAIKKLKQIPFVVLQATVDKTNIHIFRITEYNNQKLEVHKNNNSRDINVLIFRKLGGIGDIVMTFPVLELARKQYPDYKITFSCPEEFISLVENNPFVNYVEPFTKELSQRKWDIVINLTQDCINYEFVNQPNVKKNRVEVFIEKCGLETSRIPFPKVFVSEDEIDRSKSLLDGLNLKIGLVLKSNAPVRNWNKFLELRNKLLEKYPEATIIEISHEQPKDWIPNDRVHAIFNRSLREVIGIINECDIVVSPDTGIAHISSSLKVPTVWIFTHIDGKIRTKNYDQDIIEIVQQTPEECGKPCWYKVPCAIVGDRNLVEKKHNPKCSELITVDMVIEKVDKLLSIPNLSYCIIYHNRTEITKRCLEKIIQYKKFNEEIVLVDNGSDDSDFIKNYKVIAKLFRFDENKGCIIARNKAMKMAKGRYIIPLDNDQFISIDSIHRLMQTTGDIVGVEAWSMDNNGYAFSIEKKNGGLDYVGAGGMLTKKSIIEDVEYFDEVYSPAWFEDPDFCFKAKKKGYKLGYCERHGIQHLAHQTNNTQKTFDMKKAWGNSHKIFCERWLKDKANRIIEVNKINKRKMKIHCIVDVPGWAWDNKIKQIYKYLQKDFDILVAYSTQGIPIIDIDLFFFFECNPWYIPGRALNMNYICGVTAHQYVNFKNFDDILKGSVVIHANSMLLFNEIKKYNGHCFYTPNGVDEEQFAFSERNINEEFTVGYVGKNIPRKGLEDFIIPACEKAEVKLKLQSCKYKDASKISHEEMHKFYHDIDCIMVASDMDGTPNQLLEAASVGRTFIGNRIGNIPEFVNESVNGFMVERDVDAYVEKLIWLKNHRKKCYDMGIEARRTIEKEWTWKTMSQNYKMMFEEASLLI